MSSTTRLYKAIVGFFPSILPYAGAFLLFVGLAIIGNKIICGWACPLGALQELIYSIPGVEKLPKLRPRFVITNSIRAVLIALMIVVPVGSVGGRHAVTYKFLNAFNLFDLRVPVFTVLLIIAATVILSPFLYRPFCRFICPFGLVSWLAERISIFRVRVDHKLCTRCGACISACPLGAAKGIVEGKAFHEDCFSCARCLNKCPVDAIRYISIFN
jgi:polyferredoxin